jgi:AraC-like DNA-binding protein
MKRTKRYVDTDWLDMPLIRKIGLIQRWRSHPLPYHINDGYEITYSEQGHYMWEIENEDFLHLYGGQIALTQNRIRHRGFDDRINSGKLLFCVFDFQCSRFDLPFFTHNETTYFDLAFQKIGNDVANASTEFITWEKQFEQLVHQYEQGERGLAFKKLFQTHIVQGIMLALDSFTDHREVNNDVQFAEQIRSVILKNLSQQVKIDELIRLTKLGRSRFFQVFKDTFGMTPSHYIREQRCIRATELLRNSDLSITEVAHRTGFSSSQYFSTCIRNETGYTPTSYRNS